MSNYEHIIVEVNKDDSVAVLTLHRPEKLNAWHAPMRQEIADALRALNADDQVRAVVITGSGDRAFTAGQDLAETQTFSAESTSAWMEEWRNMYGAIREMEKPVIAAVNGVAAGSGFQVVLQCDVRVGCSQSRMGQPEINSGIPSTLGPWLMAATMNRSKAVELTLTGRMMDGEECFRLGLLHHFVPQKEVLPKALEIARELAQKPPVAMRLNKRRFRELTESEFQEALEAGRKLQNEAFATGEPQNMMEQFFAERAARKKTGS